MPDFTRYCLDELLRIKDGVDLLFSYGITYDEQMYAELKTEMKKKQQEKW